MPPKTSKRSREGTSSKAPEKATTKDSTVKKTKRDANGSHAKTESKEYGSADLRRKLPLSDSLKYLDGFGSYVQSEALPGALPVAQNTPQKCAYGLVAEQLSGTSFTTPRVKNQRSWLYRMQPSCVHKPYKPSAIKSSLVGDFSKCKVDPNQYRWKPTPIPSKKTDFVEGLITVAGVGSAEMKSGFAVHLYAINTSMKDRCMCNSDGDMLFVPQLSPITIRTEFGLLFVQPSEIAVVQRGMKFSIEVDGDARGYICEVFDGHFVIPDLGPIGSHGLANPRDFQSPTAAYEKRACKYTLVQKFLGELWEAELDHSPYDVVAWHGNYVPFKYDLNKFVTVNSVSVDHIDPSIFTVLTCPTNEPGVAAVDFVIFPPRWCVQQNTFRPPYYHRNCMSEYMGNIMGAYDAKPTGFEPGAGSLHSCMIGHGPDANAFKGASEAELKPDYMDGALAFMFESTYVLRLTDHAVKHNVDHDYYKAWQGMTNNFDPTAKPDGL